MAESKAKHRALNAIMVALCVVVVAAGALAVFSLRTAPQGSPESGASAPQVIAGAQTGIVTVERAGVQFSLDEGAALRDGDAIQTQASSRASLQVEGAGVLALSEQARSDLSAGEAVSVKVETGALFARMDSPSFPNAPPAVSAATAETTVTAGERSVFAVSAHTGSTTLAVLSGTVECPDAEGGTVCAGNLVSFTRADDGTVSATVSTASAAALDDFALAEAASAIDSGCELCFSADDIASAQAERAAEKSAQQAQATEEGGVATAGAAAVGGESFASGASAGASSASGGAATSAGVGSGSDGTRLCTIEIRCDTILSNLGDLAAGKSAFLPANGTILAATTVRFAEGDTVFDVLKAACSSAGVQLEYSYTPVYGSYYVEGINNLYEFDCGNESGWMYKVNGWYPNYGCSEYQVKDGDAIVWDYTCKGYGADLGSQVG